MKQSILIAAMLAISLAGCQKKEEPPAPQTDTGAAQTPPPATPAPAPETSGAPQPQDGTPESAPPLSAPKKESPPTP